MLLIIKRVFAQIKGGLGGQQLKSGAGVGKCLNEKGSQDEREQ